MDSGADFSAIPEELALALGLDLSKEKEPVRGVGGSVNSIQTKMTVIIGNLRERYSFLIPVKVILGKADFGVLLGREGFFDKFRITFDEANEKISFKRNQRGN